MIAKESIVTGFALHASNERILVRELSRKPTDDEAKAILDLLKPPSSRHLANIEGDEIVIRLPIASIPHAASVAFDATCGEAAPTVTNAVVFAREIVSALNAEQEDGTTPVHELLDRACNDAAEDGADGLSEAP